MPKDKQIEPEYDGSTPLSGAYSVMREAFITNIIAGIVQYKAYKSAGYSPNQTDNAAMASSSALLRNPNVKVRLAYKQAQLAKKHDVTAERITRERAKIAFSNIDDYMNVDEDGNVLIAGFDSIERRKLAAIESIKQTVNITRDKDGKETYETRNVQFKLYNKQEALDKLSRQLGMYENDGTPQEVTINIHNH